MAEHRPPAHRERHGFGLALDGSSEEVGRWLTTHMARGRWPLDTVIPLHHARQDAEGGGWTAYVIALVADDAYAADVTTELVAAIGEGGGACRRVDLLRLQPGLDLFYPRRGGADRQRGMLQFVEYVASDPAARARYYETQYRFSGPAMQRLHERDRNGRFVGFEVLETPHRTAGMPPWDVVHVSGFRPLQALKGFPRFRQAFQEAAEAIGEPSGRAIIKGWDEIRTKRMVRARQLWSHTVVADDHRAASSG